MSRKDPGRGRWEVERERFHLSSSRPPPPDRSRSIGDVVPQVMKQLGLEDRYWEQELAREWPVIVGPQLAKQTRPGRLERKVLYVYVSHPAWLSELSRYGQKQLLANLQKRFGPDRIKSLRLQLDPGTR